MINLQKILEMITEKEVKSVLRKRKTIDSWFVTHYGLNLYRGCTHNCSYCDGRAECYYVEGDFGKDIEVKKNAILLLDKELNPARKRKPMPRSFVVLGGGVTDSYQPIEKKYELAKQTLELIKKYNYPVHILTKSSLVERDFELIKKINSRQKVLMSISLSTADDNLAKIFEPGASLPSERLKTLKKFADSGINCGIFLMPIIPFITDSFEQIFNTLLEAKNAGAKYAIFGALTLKPGKQKDFFMQKIDKYFPDKRTEYEIIYRNESKWGEAVWEYNQSANQVFSEISTKLKIAKRIPAKIYNKILSKTDLTIVILQHLDYLLKLKGIKNPYGYSAHQISKLTQPIENYKFREISQLRGIGKFTAKIIDEIITTGTSKYYEKLL